MTMRKVAPHLPVVALLLGAVAPPSSGQAGDTYRSIFAEHFERYPRLHLQDLYKLIHQAALGSEHAVADSAAARDWLTREIAALGEGPPDPMIDSLNPDSGIVRVHLRPYLGAGGDPDLLLAAFVSTANSYSGTHDLLRELWATAMKMAAAGQLPFQRSEMERFIAKMDSSGYPAVHHSAEYENEYRPAYRVVALRYLPTQSRR